MIKLKELLELNEMTYNDGPSEKHQDRIDRPITIFEDLEFAPIVYPVLLLLGQNYYMINWMVFGC